MAPTPTFPALLPTFRLDGRAALVTGAGAGIGAAISAALAEAGAEVHLASLHVSEMRKSQSRSVWLADAPTSMPVTSPSRMPWAS